MPQAGFEPPITRECLLEFDTRSNNSSHHVVKSRKNFWKRLLKYFNQLSGVQASKSWSKYTAPGPDKYFDWNPHRHEDGILHEHGPRTIRPAGLPGANTLELAEELGLSDQIIPIKTGHPATKNRLLNSNMNFYFILNSWLKVVVSRILYLFLFDSFSYSGDC